LKRARREREGGGSGRGRRQCQIGSRHGFDEGVCITKECVSPRSVYHQGVCITKESATLLHPLSHQQPQVRTLPLPIWHCLAPPLAPTTNTLVRVTARVARTTSARARERKIKKKRELAERGWGGEGGGGSGEGRDHPIGTRHRFEGGVYQRFIEVKNQGDLMCHPFQTH